MRKVLGAISLLLLVSFLSGCGETVHGMVTDTKRIGRGVKKIFVRD
ncbi:MAG: hypothetical protein GF408_01765 [Candidatus Omnitrophica bacterium]|nr:hypothetical protein [Candidatus Omnitrophota bacterium]